MKTSFANRALAVVWIAALGGLTACGADGGSANVAVDAGTDVAAACDAYVEIVQQFSNNQEPDLEEIERRAAELEANRPEAVSDQLQTVLEGVDRGLDGENTFFLEDEFVEASAEVDAFMFDNCGFAEVLDVVAVDFGYEGVPDTVSPGMVAVSLENASDVELHELVLIRKNDDVTESFDELLELPEEEAMVMTSTVGHVFAPPQGEGTTFVELDEGEYLAICFIPEGASMDDGPDDEPTGPPHFALGMLTEFSVQ